ncbi:CocE/NonD family hydrolase [Streptomyces sp. NPDC059909]|uniref:CocE/NonD family hydrolase n=1 Tax=Streptomyces sp. NPDC059909 TaxID=3346998 RepID=UPI00364B9C5F
MSASQSTPSDGSLTGDFRDGPFVGLGYQTSTHEGVTDEAGRFFYQAGETVTFFIGSLVIGTAAAAAHLTLASLRDSAAAGDPDPTLPGTVNRARFVQSLGREADLRSGVTIDKTVRDVVSLHAEDISFERDAESFATSDAVRAVFSGLGLRFRGSAEARNHLRRALAGIKLFRDVKVPTRDGSYLLADVFRPLEAGSYPVLMRLGIYGRAFETGSAFSEADHAASEEKEAAWFEKSTDGIPPYFRYSENAVSANAGTWVPRGYVVVRVDGRGVGNTPGTLNPFSRQEALDYYDAIQWAAEQSWSNGNVGLYGGSYNATIQWNVAALQPPALKAIAPLSSDSDAYRDLAYPGGILLKNYRRWWWEEMVGKARGRNADAVDFIDELASHPWDDDYYAGEGLLSADFAGIDIPVLTAVSQTLMIHSRAGFEAFSQLSSPFKQLLVLDAGYSSYMYEDCRPELETFFDRFLKGAEPAREPSPVRMIMRTGDGGFEWRDAATWPVPGTEYRKLYLDTGNGHGHGTITPQLPEHMGTAEYSADVRAAAPGLPMAVFESAPFDEDLELAGHFRAVLWVASSSADADFFVALRVMDGQREVTYQTRDPESVAPLTWGCLKASHRVLDPERSTTERPWHTHRREDALPLLPGKVVKLEVEMMAATGRIAAGHHLRIEISPAEGRGATPGWERDYDDSYHHEAVNRVFTGRLLPSSITLPVVPRQAP